MTIIARCSLVLIVTLGWPMAHATAQKKEWGADPVRAQLDEAKGTFQEKMAAADRKLEKAWAEGVDRATKKLKKEQVREKLQLEDELEEQLRALRAVRLVPDGLDGKLKRAAKAFGKDADRELGKLRKAFERAMRTYDREKLEDLARGVLEEERTFFAELACGARDDQLCYWTAGKAGGTGKRGKIATLSKGEVIESTAEHLVVQVNEKWEIQQGPLKNDMAKHVYRYLFERIAHDPVTGKIELKLVGMKVKKGKRGFVTSDRRHEIDGLVTLEGRRLEGWISYVWYNAKGEKQLADKEPLRLDLP